MIEVITPGNRRSYEPVIESMFRMRYRALVEDCGWRIPDLTGERDCDQFDTADTIYFVDCAPETGDVVACARLNPTTKPHMLSDVFSRYCDLQSAPACKTIYEATRIAIDRRRLDPAERRRAIRRLEWAVTEFALRGGIKKLTGFVSDKVYVHTIGLWTTRPLGLPAHFDDDDRTYIPAISVMDEAALRRLAERRRLAAAADASTSREAVDAGQSPPDAPNGTCARACPATANTGAELPGDNQRPQMRRNAQGESRRSTHPLRQTRRQRQAGAGGR